MLGSLASDVLQSNCVRCRWGHEHFSIEFPGLLWFLASSGALLFLFLYVFFMAGPGVIFIGW